MLKSKVFKKLDLSALNPDAILDSTQRLISTESAQVITELPQRLEMIRAGEMWRGWRKGNGDPYESFVDCLSTAQPYGLGLGQLRAWATPTQVYYLCQGFSDVQDELRPLVAGSVKPLPKHGGARTPKQVDNINLNGGGTGQEYLLRRLKRHDVQKGTDFIGRWGRGEFKSVRAACIAAGIVKVKDSDTDRDEFDRIRMYWNRASVATRRKIAAAIAEAGTKKIARK